MCHSRAIRHRQCSLPAIENCAMFFEVMKCCRLQNVPEEMCIYSKRLVWSSYSLSPIKKCNLNNQEVHHICTLDAMFNRVTMSTKKRLSNICAPTRTYEAGKNVGSCFGFRHCHASKILVMGQFFLNAPTNYKKFDATFWCYLSESICTFRNALAHYKKCNTFGNTTPESNVIFCNALVYYEKMGALWKNWCNTRIHDTLQWLNPKQEPETRNKNPCFAQSSHLHLG